MLVGHVLEAVLNGDLSALIPPGLSSMIDGAKDAINEELNKLNPAKEFMNDLENRAKNQFEDWMPDASELERIEKDINGLLKDVETWGKNVVSDIGNTVQDALGSGQIPAQPMVAWGRPMTTLHRKARFPWMWEPCREWGRTLLEHLARAMGDMEIRGAATADREAPDRARVEPGRSAGPAPARAPQTQAQEEQSPPRPAI